MTDKGGASQSAFFNWCRPIDVRKTLGQLDYGFRSTAVLVKMLADFFSHRIRQNVISCGEALILPGDLLSGEKRSAIQCDIFGK